MLVRNNIAPRPRIPQKRTPDKGTLDAVADLRDWLTDTETKTTAPGGPAGEALVALQKALVDGDDAYVRKAYGLVSLLKERNGHTLGQDVPANHAVTNGPDFRCVLEMLQDRLHDRMLEHGGRQL